MRILVLGSGVIGTSVAYYLARAGHEVTVLERQPAPALLPSAVRAARPLQRPCSAAGGRKPSPSRQMCPQAFAPAAVWPSGPFREGGAPRSRAARASISAAQVLCSAAAKTRPPRGEARPTATVGRRRGRDKGGGGCGHTGQLRPRRRGRWELLKRWIGRKQLLFTP